MKVKTILPLSLPTVAAVIIVLMVSPPGFAQVKMAGLTVSAALWIIGYALLRWAQKQNERILLGVLLGGILFRMAIALLSMYFVRQFTQLELIPYVISLMIFYLACEFALVMDFTLRKT